MQASDKCLRFYLITDLRMISTNRTFIQIRLVSSTLKISKHIVCGHCEEYRP